MGIKITDAQEKQIIKETRFTKNVNGSWQAVWKYADGYQLSIGVEGSYHLARTRGKRKLIDFIKSREDLAWHGIPNGSK